MPPTCCPRAEELGCSQPHVVLLQLKLLINRFHFFVFLSSCTAASSFPSQVSVLFLALNAAVEVPGPKTSGGARVAQSRQQQELPSAPLTYCSIFSTMSTASPNTSSLYEVVVIFQGPFQPSCAVVQWWFILSPKRQGDH